MRAFFGYGEIGEYCEPVVLGLLEGQLSVISETVISKERAVGGASVLGIGEGGLIGLRERASLGSDVLMQGIPGLFGWWKDKVSRLGYLKEKFDNMRQNGGSLGLRPVLPSSGFQALVLGSFASGERVVLHWAHS